MPEQPAVMEKTHLINLHAATCLTMTQFINGHHCPKLAHLIVHQLRRLLAHPELEQLHECRDMYQQLLEHWQNITAHLLEQQNRKRPHQAYH